MPDVTVTPTVQSVTVTPTVQSVTVTEGSSFSVEFPLAVSSAFLGSNQAATASTWYTLGGLTLGPGTYLLIGTVTGITTGNSGNIDGAIYNGTTAAYLAGSSTTTPRSSTYGSVTVHCTLTIASTTLVQLRGNMTQTGTFLTASSLSVANATGIIALRIA